MSKERWKDIPEFKGYQISDLGRVRSIKRLDSAGRKRKGKMLNHGLNKNGYIYIILCKEGKQYNRRISALVAAAFLGHDRTKTRDVISYKDGNKTNCKFNNLIIRTQKESIRASIKRKKKDKYIGINYVESRDKWIADIYLNKKSYKLGSFDTKEEAIQEYERAEKEFKETKKVTIDTRRRYSSKHEGIYIKNNLKIKKWVATLKIEGRHIFLGNYRTEQEAYEDQLRVKKELENTGRFTKLNTTTCIYKGVSFVKAKGMYRAEIQRNKIRHHVGYYDNPKIAYNAYLKKARELDG